MPTGVGAGVGAGWVGAGGAGWVGVVVVGAGWAGTGRTGAGRATISSPGTGSRPANRQASTTKGAAAPGCSHRENARSSRRLTLPATGEAEEASESSQALARFQLSFVSMRGGVAAAALPGEGADDGAPAGGMGMGGADKMSSFLELLGAWCAPLVDIAHYYWYDSSGD